MAKAKAKPDPAAKPEPDEARRDDGPRDERDGRKAAVNRKKPPPAEPLIIKKGFGA